MFDRREILDGGRRPLLAAGAITVAVAVSLAATGCSAVSSAPSLASSQAPDGTSSATVGLSGAPGISGFGSPATKIAPHNPLSGPPADPFSGTPSDHWADGAAGIVLPAAEPVGGYTAEQVESACEKTRELLGAAYLDRKTLLGGQPTAFADLLTGQEETWFLDNLGKTGVDKQGDDLSSRDYVMAFPPGDAQLIGSVIKVRGTMRAQAATSNGQSVLDIDTDYIFVYPVEPPDRPGGWMRIVTQESWTVSFGDWTGGATSFEPWVDETGGGVAGAQCGTTDGYEHPDYPTTSRPGRSRLPAAHRSIPTRWGRRRPRGHHRNARPRRAPDRSWY